MKIEDYPIGSGRYLIEASAGTGKTWTITHLFRRLVLEGMPVSRILVTTFTNTGAAELKERIVELLNDTLTTLDPDDPDAKKQELRLRLAVSSIDEMTIGTIHSFCQKMLHEYTTGSGETLIPDESEYRDRLVRAFFRAKYYGSETFPEKGLLSDMQKAAAISSAGEIRSMPEGNELRDVFEYVRARIGAEKEQDGVLSFDDLIRKFLDALKEDPSLAGKISRRYRAVFVDEFQDTDQTQFEIFDRCFPKDGGNLFYMIGDPKQAIYAFRGADIYTYLEAKKTASMSIPLAENFRSTPYMLDAVNWIFGGCGSDRDSEPKVIDGVFLQPDIPYITVTSGHKPPEERFPHMVRNALRLRHYVAKKKVAEELIYQDVVREIRWLLSEDCTMEVDEEKLEENGETNIRSHRLKASDIAILVQRHDQAAEFVRRLNLEGIPASACKSGKIYDSREARVMLLLLNCLLDPSERNIRGLLLTPFFRFSAEQLLREEYDLEQISGALSQMASEWRESGLPSAFLRFLDTPLTGNEITPRLSLMSEQNGERAITNYLQLMELLFEKESDRHLLPEDVLNYLNLAIAGQDEGDAEQKGNEDNPDQLRLDRDSAAVQLLTIFASKGMEFPIVFVPFPAKTAGAELIKRETAYKIREDDGSFLFDFDRLDENKPSVYAETLRSQLRLLYVALTRGAYATYLYTQERPAGDRRLLNFKNSAQGIILTDPPAIAGNGTEYYRTNQDNLPRQLTTWFKKLVKDGEREWEVFERYPDRPAGPLRADEPPEGELAAGSRPNVPDRWRVMSFSTYRSQWNHAGEEDEDKTENPADRDSQLTGDGQTPARTGSGTFRDFPRGDRVGTMVHDLLEDLHGRFSDFAPDAPPETTEEMKRLIDRTLSSCGYDPKTLGGPLFDGICRALQTPLPEIGIPLCAIRNYMQETEFFLDAENGLDLHGILKIMKEQASEQVRTRITGHVIPFGRKGMVNGLTDLIFEHEGKYYIVDWKTNYLGRRDSDYAPDRIMDDMIEERYVLQAYLYSAALLQMLRRNGLSDDRFGGVFYLFIRGMGTGGQNGIWHDVPPLKCLNAMLEMFQRGERP